MRVTDLVTTLTGFLPTGFTWRDWRNYRGFSHLGLYLLYLLYLFYLRYWDRTFGILDFGALELSDFGIRTLGFLDTMDGLDTVGYLKHTLAHVEIGH